MCFLRSPTCQNAIWVVNGRTFRHTVMSDASRRWQVGNVLYFTCSFFSVLKHSSPCPLYSNWEFLCRKVAAILHRLLTWEPLPSVQPSQLTGAALEEMIVKPRAQWVPFWAFAGNSPLLLCFGRWGSSSRHPFRPTTSPQQLPQPRRPLRYVLSAPNYWWIQLSSNTCWPLRPLKVAHVETLRVPCLLNLCKWRILAIAQVAVPNTLTACLEILLKTIWTVQERSDRAGQVSLQSCL